MHFSVLIEREQSEGQIKFFGATEEKQLKAIILAKDLK